MNECSMSSHATQLLRSGLFALILLSAFMNAACGLVEADTGGVSHPGGASGIGASSSGTTGSGGAAGAATFGTHHAYETLIEPGTVAVTTDYGEDTGNSGFRGRFWVSWDHVGSSVFPTDLSDRTPEERAENKVCVYGVAAEVRDGQFATYWGAKLGWSINQGQGDSDSIPGDFSATRGIRFTVHSETAAQLRFNVEQETTQYCTAIRSGDNTVLWADLATDCRTDGGTPFEPAVNPASHVSWQVPGVIGGATPFDFCVGGIEFLPL